MSQSRGFKISCLFLSFLSLTQILNAAVDSTWVTTSDPDLNTSTNWSPPTVPTGQATFDSTIPGVVFLPTANSLFALESFFFPNSASDFLFTFTGPGALVFTGNGMTGTNTNTTVNATNDTAINTPQIGFYKDPASTSTVASLGSAVFSAINSGTINGNTFSINFAQIVLADIESSVGHLPVTVGNGAALIAANYGTIDATGSEEAAQIFLKGDSFGIGTPANNVIVSASNRGTLEAAGNCGQLLLDAGAVINTFTLGNAPVFTLINDASTISSNRNNAGQWITDGFDGAVDFVVGNNAVFTLINRNIASISNPTLTGNDAAQILFDGNDGRATLTCGDNAIFSLSNQLSSAIQGLGFDSAQMVFDGDGGNAAFVSGKNTSITLTNDRAQIQSGTDGHDAAQLLVDGNFGSASFTVGDNSIINATNNGSISIANNVPGIVVGQIVFDGHLADPAGSVFLTTGSNVKITATNGPAGTIDNFGGITSPAQFYFSDATINGDPTLTAINQGSNSIKGIVFKGSSTANLTNIALQNASLVVDTTTPLTIASLQGDATSTGELSQNLNIALRNGTNTTFAGVIKDTLGTNSLTISGVGTQVLTGHNTYAGGTTVKSGNLVVDGSIINNVLVTGGQLSGTGTIGTSSPLSTTTVTGGAVKPGDSPGILTNLGNYIQTGGTLKIDLNGLGNVPGVNNGELLVGGTTTLSEPAFVTVNSLDGSFYIGGRYTILASKGPVNGIFDPTVVTNTQIIPVITYDSNDVYLSFQEPFLGCACNSNGRHVAEQLFTITNPNAEEQFLLSAITSLSCPDIGSALNALSGAPYAEQLIGTEIATHQFVRRLYDPLRAFLYKNPRCYECECNKGIETWVEVGGIHSNFKPKHHCGCSNKLKTNGYQISAGAQTECDHKWAVGAALSYEHTTSKFHHKGSASTKTVLGALYGTYRMCKYYIMGDLVIGGNTAKLNRHFKIGNAKFSQKGRPEALQGILYGEFGYDFRYCSLLVQPFFGLEGGCFNYKHFSEHRHNIARLRFKKKNYGTFDTRLGVHLSTDELACGLFIGIDLAWQCRTTELKNSLKAEFAKFGTDFALHKTKLNRNSFEAALNLEQKIDDRWSIYATGFWQQWQSNSYAYDILGGISYSW